MFFRGKALCGVTRVSLLTAVSLLQANAGGDSTPRLTPAAAGPYQVDGNRILDARGRAYLVRGTELPTLTLKDSDIAGDGKEFGAFSPSSLISIRQRLNMNAVRLPVNPLEYQEDSAYRARLLEVVESANAFELLVILAVDPDGPLSPQTLAQFWTRCAGDFKHHPNVFFAVAPAPGMRADSGWSLWQSAMQALVEAVRSGGAQQPVLLAGLQPDGFDGVTPSLQVHDRNVIYEATPRYATTRTDADRWRQFGSLSTRAPVLVNDMDPQLDRNSAECAAFPGDPGAATRLVQENLAYFDAHQVSWVLSSYRPGKMLTEYRYFNWSKLDDGWTCGESPSRGGIAMMLVAHLWSGDPHGLFAVNHVNGGLVLARGGLATAYGPILAEREVTAPSGRPLPLVLGNVSVRVTDSKGIARLARLQYTGAGWSDISFVVPASAALGPAEVAVVRSDGSKSAARVIIADVSPGFFTASFDARGAVSGEVMQRDVGGGQSKSFAASECVAGHCRAVPIPLSDRVTTTVRLAASGLRNGGSHAKVRVTVGKIAVPVMSFGPADDVGRDQVTIQLPVELRGAGETDLTMTVNGALSNVARIHCGAL
jgi:uncharacterized protein (TIGR03437 family)